MNRKVKSAIVVILLIITLCGCSTVDLRSGSDTAKVAGQSIIPGASKYVQLERKITAPEKVIIAPAPISSTLQQALARYVPKDYKVSVASDIDPATPLRYDASLPWIEALGKALADSSLEMNANMFKKEVFIKAFETPLGDAIEKYVPADYKVFTDIEINIETLIRYDASLYWIDALSKGAAHSGIDVTANITKKIVLLKPLITTKVRPAQPDSFSQKDEPSGLGRIRKSGTN